MQAQATSPQLLRRRRQSGLCARGEDRGLADMEFGQLQILVIRHDFTERAGQQPAHTEDRFDEGTTAMPAAGGGRAGDDQCLRTDGFEYEAISIETGQTGDLRIDPGVAAQMDRRRIRGIDGIGGIHGIDAQIDAGTALEIVDEPLRGPVLRSHRDGSGAIVDAAEVAAAQAAGARWRLLPCPFSRSDPWRRDTADPRTGSPPPGPRRVPASAGTPDSGASGADVSQLSGSARRPN